MRFYHFRSISIKTNGVLRYGFLPTLLIWRYTFILDFIQRFLAALWISLEDILYLESIDITKCFKISFIDNEWSFPMWIHILDFGILRFSFEDFSVCKLRREMFYIWDILYLKSRDISEHFIKKWVSIHAFGMTSYIYLRFYLKIPRYYRHYWVF